MAYPDSKTLQATGEIVVCSEMIVVNKAFLFSNLVGSSN